MPPLSRGAFARPRAAPAATRTPPAASATTTLPDVSAIPARGWFIDIHAGPTLPKGPAGIACGNVVAHEAHVLRFATDNLIVRAGDTVTWGTQDPLSAHTITFVPAGRPIPTNLGPATAQTYDGTALASSGALAWGQTYTLTFPRPGIYAYRSLTDGTVGMTATISVIPGGLPPLADAAIHANGAHLTPWQVQWFLQLAHP